MPFLSSLLFWLFTITGNIQPCDTDVPLESESDTCEEQSSTSALSHLKWTSPNRPSNDISNGF